MKFLKKFCFHNTLTLLKAINNFKAPFNGNGNSSTFEFILDILIRRLKKSRVQLNSRTNFFHYQSRAT